MRRISIPLAILALAVSAVSAPSVWAQETKKPLAKAAPAGTSPARAKPTVEIIRVPSDMLQRRRQGIAKMLEAHRWFRGGIFAGGAAKIAEAKLAGPFQYTAKKWFSSETTTRTLYCAVVTLALPLNPGHTALIEVLHPKEGGERMLMTIQRSYAPFECHKADYKPFPEVVQLRTQRRRALGNAD